MVRPKFECNIWTHRLGIAAFFAFDFSVPSSQLTHNVLTRTGQDETMVVSRVGRRTLYIYIYTVVADIRHMLSCTVLLNAVPVECSLSQGRDMGQRRVLPIQIHCTRV
jgi:hypothetical protein